MDRQTDVLSAFPPSPHTLALPQPPTHLDIPILLHVLWWVLDGDTGAETGQGSQASLYPCLLGEGSLHGGSWMGRDGLALIENRVPLSHQELTEQCLPTENHQRGLGYPNNSPGRRAHLVCPLLR